MALIQDRARSEIKKLFETLDKPVKIINFTQEFECTYCRDTRELLTELWDLSDKIGLEVFDFVGNKDEAERYKIDKIPAIVLLGDNETGIRFYGIPAGYEFGTLIEDILMVSRRDSGLAPDTRKKLAALTAPIHLQVFVTPT